MDPKTSILITDKNQKTLQSVAAILEMQGYHVTTACCWSQTLHFIKNCYIDIAIIDIHMDKSGHSGNVRHVGLLRCSIAT